MVAASNEVELGFCGGTVVVASNGVEFEFCGGMVVAGISRQIVSKQIKQ